MGVALIWIDSLSIIQDEMDDWARHAEQMDNIYQHALFVVAASSSPAASVPFLGPDAPTNRYTYRTVQIKTAATKHGASNSHSIMTTRVRNLAPQLSPSWVSGSLEDRAWAWQERYCATRVISFTDVETKWQCKEFESCESLGVMQSRELRGIHLEDDNGSILRQWREVVHEYAGRNLTYGTYRLPAIAGIASRFHGRVGSNYLTGLWEIELPYNLSWYRRDLTNSSTDTPLILPAMNNGVPTWSWASNYLDCCWLWDHYFAWEGPSLGDQERAEFELKSHVQVTRIDCVPIASNAFGNVNEGSYIELTGCLVPATMQCDIYGRASVWREGFEFESQVVMLDCKTHPVDVHGTDYMQRDAIFEPESTSKDGEEIDIINTWCIGAVVCLLLYTATWRGDTQACILILGKVEVTGRICYQRLGLGCGHLENWSGALHRVRKG
jgi:hypothetical protein